MHPVRFRPARTIVAALLLVAGLAGCNAATPPTVWPGSAQGVLTPPAALAFPAQAVSWLHSQGTTVSGDTLRKVLASDDWDAGAISDQAIITGTDGYGQMTVADTRTMAMFGLDSAQSLPDYDAIDFAFYLNPPDNGLYISEAGVQGQQVGDYQVGDVLVVAVQKGQVQYYRNDALVYTSLVPPRGALLLACNLFSRQGVLKSPRIGGTELMTLPAPAPMPPQAVNWTHGVGIQTSADTVRKTRSTNAWDAGAISDQAILTDTDGYIQVTVVDTRTAAMFGLSSSGSLSRYAVIDFAFDLNPSNDSLYVYESGRSRGRVGSYRAGDVLKVASESLHITYYRNGVPIYASKMLPGGALALKCSLYSAGGMLKSPQIGGVQLIALPPSPSPSPGP